MISVITSTRNEVLLKKFSDNIQKTIGVPCEIIPVENHAKYSLCEAYNIGADKAQYSYLCFVHEDVIFLNLNWGNRLVSLMKSDEKIGLIGVVGTKFKTSYPNVGWGTGPYVKGFYRGQIFLDEALNKKDFDYSITKNEIDDVVTLDGLILFTKREVYEKCRFDENLLTGFHGYDTDFSLQVFFQSYRVIVDRGTEVIHPSTGSYNREYALANRKIRKKWLSKLPVATQDTNLTKIGLVGYDMLCWAGYLRNMIIRKLHIPLKLK